jgi:hypothetical protein
MIDNLLSTFVERQVCSIPIDNLLDILDFQYAAPNSRGTWKDDLIKQAISSLKSFPEYGDEAALVIVSRSSDRKKDRSREYRGIGSVLPGGFSTSRLGIPSNRPALLLTRFNGDIDYLPDGTNRGWDGVPFWVPVIQFPDGNYAFSVNRS